MITANETDRRSAWTRRTRRLGRLYSRFLLYLVVVAILAGVNAVRSPGEWWFGWPALGLGLALLATAWRTLVTPCFTAMADEHRK